MPPIVDIPLLWTQSPSEDTKTALQWLKATAVEQLLLATENGRTMMVTHFSAHSVFLKRLG